MEKENRIILVTENTEPLEAGEKCIFDGVKLITEEKETSCLGCYFCKKIDCPINYNCENVIYVKE